MVLYVAGYPGNYGVFKPALFSEDSELARPRAADTGRGKRGPFNRRAVGL